MEEVCLRSGEKYNTLKGWVLLCLHELEVVRLFGGFRGVIDWVRIVFVETGCSFQVINGVKGARLIFCCICNTYATAHMQPFLLHMPPQ